MIRDAEFRSDDFASEQDHLHLPSQSLGTTPTMLSTSIRRAAWAPLSSAPRAVQSVPSTGLLGATRYVHQRRYSSSSSKPPVPPSDGSQRLDTSTPAKNVNSSGEKSKAARRRGKDAGARNGSSKSSGQHAAFSKLPSVPSTQHQQPHGEFRIAGNSLPYSRYVLYTNLLFCTRCSRCFVLLHSPPDLRDHHGPPNLEPRSFRIDLLQKTHEEPA